MNLTDQYISQSEAEGRGGEELRPTLGRRGHGHSCSSLPHSTLFCVKVLDNQPTGVIYFADDDNAYSRQLWEVIRCVSAARPGVVLRVQEYQEGLGVPGGAGGQVTGVQSTDRLKITHPQIVFN